MRMNYPRLLSFRSWSVGGYLITFIANIYLMTTKWMTVCTRHFYMFSGKGICAFWLKSICSLGSNQQQAALMVSLFVCLFVWFITNSFLTYSFLPPTPASSTISRPLSSSMCSITPETANVGSSYNRMRGPGIGCWFSDRSNCSQWSFEATVLPINPNIYTDQWEPIVICHSNTFTGPYTTIRPTLLTSSWLQLLSYNV